MNEQGSRPVIVLNPIHPHVLAALRGRGFPARKAALAYLRGGCTSGSTSSWSTRTSAAGAGR